MRDRTYGYGHGKLARRDTITVRRTDQSYKGDNKDRRTNLLDNPMSFCDSHPTIYAVNEILQRKMLSAEQNFDPADRLRATDDHGLRNYARFLRSYSPLIEIYP